MIDFDKVRRLQRKQCHTDIFQTRDRSLFPPARVYENMYAVSFCPDSIKLYLSECNTYLRVSTRCGRVIYHVLWKDHLDVPMTAIMRSVKQALTVCDVCAIKKDMHFYITMSPFKRQMPDAGDLIDSEHINGGFTAINENEIYVIRSEEFSKVIIHELIHHCGFINDNKNYTRQVGELKREFNIAPETLLLPNEAVVEFWATVLHCLFLSLEYGIPFSDILSIEQEHSVLQSNKIIKRQGRALWRERTNSYSYIVFKAILLNNYKEFSKMACPYDINKVTRFLIDRRHSMKRDERHKGLFQRTRGIRSLRMMYLSDFI